MHSLIQAIGNKRIPIAPFTRARNSIFFSFFMPAWNTLSSCILPPLPIARSRETCVCKSELGSVPVAQKKSHPFAAVFAFKKRFARSYLHYSALLPCVLSPWWSAVIRSSRENPHTWPAWHTPEFPRTITRGSAEFYPISMQHSVTGPRGICRASPPRGCRLRAPPRTAEARRRSPRRSEEQRESPNVLAYLTYCTSNPPRSLPIYFRE